ncbi:UDP-glucuronosyltransferase 1A5-like [Branchiostoma lanceolatum]|uniref:UDP-glucuronosyltransferase 1A5-like n=1 Tax=Branchiostoma lanceolatum TaxID=7740 RepID=UPI00345476A0
MAFSSTFVGIVAMLVCILADQRTHGGKVLFVPSPDISSHWFSLAYVGQALAGRGHAITAIVPESIVARRRMERPDFEFETFQDGETLSRLQAIDSQELSMVMNDGQVTFLTLLKLRYTWARQTAKHCELLVGNSSLLGRLRAARYDTIATDGAFQCGFILAAMLEIPNVAHLVPMVHDSRATGVPCPISYVPSPYSSFVDTMTFLERVQNVVSHLQTSAFLWLSASTHDELARRHLGDGKATLIRAMSQTDLWLDNADPLLDSPQPSMPNIVQVGGFHVKNATALSEDLKSFVEGSGNNGVVVVSFGTLIPAWPKRHAEVLAAAFSRLRQRVVWRHDGESPPGLGNNTRLMKWLPQNDLLGHPKTRAFVTHSGRNSVYEAVYHGVPMVCLPIAWDQPGNAARMVARGVGVSLNHFTLTTDELYQAIMQVITDKRYAERAGVLSRLYRDQPQPPMERLVWWIEHVIKHGGLPHLRSRAVDLPLYQYYLLDVAGFLIVIFSAGTTVVWLSCSFMCKKCRGGDKVKSH